ncbi:MAG: hypothetical protein ACREQW_04505, partial [Candidatus Binatia bacterium]
SSIMAADVLHTSGMITCGDGLGFRVFRMKFHSRILNVTSKNKRLHLRGTTLGTRQQFLHVAAPLR